ncbi:AMP-dependent synthetase/ligase [Pseudomonadota bacterium]
MTDNDTFPKLLKERSRVDGDRTAIREKEFGIWQSWTWKDVDREVRQLASGLAAMGFKRGDKLAIIGDNRPRLYWSMAAAQCLGGIPVPTYQDAVLKELEFVLEHAGTRFVVAENQEQVDKVLEIQTNCPVIEEIIFDDERGLRNYARDHLYSFVEVQKRGEAHQKELPQFLDEEIDQGSGQDTAIMLYTSGTTGSPKGVMLSHDNVLITAANGIELEKLNKDEEVLAYLPMAWVGDHIFSYGQSYVSGFCVSCPENSSTVMQDMRDIGPTYFFAPPAIFENLLTTVMIRIEDAAWLKRKIFSYFMDLAKQVGTKILDGEKASFGEKIRYALGNLLIYGPLKNTLGLSRIRLAYTAGEAIGPEIFEFYRSLGINIKQLYGQTESAVFVTIQPNGEVYQDTVGKPAPQVELNITDDGEVLYRGPGVFQRYYKNDEATAEAKTEDGWVHTGDAGFRDRNGHLKIIDRAKDVGKFNDGSMFAPKYIENKLKFFPYIKVAVAFGDQHDFCTVVINIDLEAVGNWAEKNNVPYASYQELAADERVYALVQQCIEKVNADLVADEKLASSQVHRFVILHKELDADDGELTRTLKVRRPFIYEKYSQLIAALFTDQDYCHMETQMTFEDGRTGMVSADLRIINVQPSVAFSKAS